MSSVQVQLPNIPTNWYMSWSMSTQASNNICVTLKDSTSTYVNNVCRASKQFGILSEGFQQVAGTGLNLSINVSTNHTLQTVVSPYSVATPTGLTVGQGYNIVLEDGTDNDFNDLFVSVIAWASAG